MVAAGKLNKKVIIQQQDNSVDAIGQPVANWIDVCNPWAEIRHPTGISAIKAGADVSIVQASIRIRFRVGLDESMRVVHGANIYDIKALLPDARAEYIDLVCQKVS